MRGLLALGDIIFELRTLPLQSTERTLVYRYAEQLPVGAAPQYQYLGPGSNTLTLAGVLYPEITGGPVHLDALAALAATGQPAILIDGTGRSHGEWLITRITDTRTHFFADGVAQKIDFTVALTFVADQQPRRDILGGQGYDPADFEGYA